MNIEELRNYCLSLKHVEESFPFNESALVFKVKGKMFCLTNIDNYEYINVKCKPEDAIELREKYNEVEPGYHMNKKHWNSIYMKGRISPDIIKEWILNSYNLAIATLPKNVRENL